MTQEDFFYQCIDLIEQFFNGTRKMGDLQELTDKLYNEVTKPHWISVHEELPKDGQHAATINKVGVQDVRHYSHGKWHSNFGNEYDDITHWMPLPQAPTVVKNATVKKGCAQ